VLLKVKKEIGGEWKSIGYYLGFTPDEIYCIEENSQTVEKRAFNMLEKWFLKDTNACYCKLITAMTEESLISGVEVLKQNIEKCKCLT